MQVNINIILPLPPRFFCLKSNLDNKDEKISNKSIKKSQHSITHRLIIGHIGELGCEKFCIFSIMGY